ncbi:MAG: hypothetical protein N2C14_14340 [Planctomycetales bacterium]
MGALVACMVYLFLLGLPLGFMAFSIHEFGSNLTVHKDHITAIGQAATGNLAIPMAFKDKVATKDVLKRSFRSFPVIVKAVAYENIGTAKKPEWVFFEDYIRKRDSPTGEHSDQEPNEDSPTGEHSDQEPNEDSPTGEHSDQEPNEDSPTGVKSDVHDEKKIVTVVLEVDQNGVVVGNVAVWSDYSEITREYYKAQWRNFALLACCWLSAGFLAIWMFRSAADSSTPANMKSKSRYR